MKTIAFGIGVYQTFELPKLPIGQMVLYYGEAYVCERTMMYWQLIVRVGENPCSEVAIEYENTNFRHRGSSHH